MKGRRSLPTHTHLRGKRSVREYGRELRTNCCSCRTREAHARACNGVNVWRRNVTAMVTGVIVPQIVDQNEHHVGSLLHERHPS